MVSAFAKHGHFDVLLKCSGDLHIDDHHTAEDSALALGMIHVIIRDGLVDQDYVEKYTVGFDALSKRAQEYAPDRVARITGLTVSQIEQLSHDYAKAQPSAIRIGVAIERNGNGGQAVRALSALPALVGAFRKPGGGILQLPLWAFPIRWDKLMRPEWIKPGTPVRNQWKIGQDLLATEDKGPIIRSLFVYNANPMVVAAEQGLVRRGLMREDLFTVVSEHFITDTARFADIVLPATTQAEQLDLMFSWGQLYITMNQPWIAPLGEAVPNTELFRRLAREMGMDDPQFSLTDDELAQQSYDWSAPALQGITYESLKVKGWARLNLPDAAHYAPHAEGGFPTPSGKVEFEASMAAGGNFVLGVFRQGSEEFQDGSPVDSLPSWTPPKLDQHRPLTLISPKSHAFLNSGYGNMDRQLSHAGKQQVMMHPDDAASRGIVHGQNVSVTSSTGSFHALADITTDVAPGVVQSAMGYWGSGMADGAGVNSANPAHYGDLGRSPAFSDTRVEIATAS
jgi:anaerobic selenocysteine-containing dehydrogenase